MSFLTDALSLSIVPRWSVVPHIGQQSVADHSIRVVFIADEIRRRMKDSPYRQLNLLWGALIHDVEECVTGDIPGPAKALMCYDRRRHAPLVEVPDGPGLTLAEIKLIKVADLIEAATYINMWGKGLHAQHAYAHLKEKIEDLHTEPYYTAAASVMQEILLDSGRLRV